MRKIILLIDGKNRKAIDKIRFQGKINVVMFYKQDMKEEEMCMRWKKAMSVCLSAAMICCLSVVNVSAAADTSANTGEIGWEEELIPVQGAETEEEEWSERTVLESAQEEVAEKLEEESSATFPDDTLEPMEEPEDGAIGKEKQVDTEEQSVAFEQEDTDQVEERQEERTIQQQEDEQEDLFEGVAEEDELVRGLTKAVGQHGNAPEAMGASGKKINVTDSEYGAKGSDRKDDTEAIQKALDEVGEAGGGTVYIPSGKYYIEKSLIIYSNTTLELHAKAEIIQNIPSDLEQVMLRNYIGKRDDVLSGEKYGYTKNITITGGTWNGNVSNGKQGADLIRINCATNVEVSNCTLTGVCGFHHLDFASVDGIVVDQVTLTGFVKYDKTDYSSLETGKENVNEKNETASITSEAVQFDGFEGNYCKNIKVSNCLFKGVMSGVGNHHHEGKAQSVEITGNTFDTVENTCVNIYGFNNVKVSGNKANNVRAFASVYGGKNITISDNEIATYTNSKISKYNMFRITNKAELTISNNRIKGSGNSVIKLDKGAKAVIKNNIIENATTYAIHVDQSSATIQGNTIRKAKSSGIKLQDAQNKVVISGNKFLDPGEYGIYTVSSVVEAKNNSVQNSAMSAIYLKGGSGKVIDNSINVTRKGAGIYIVEKAKVSSISGNTIVKAKENGIYIKGATATTISNNTIKNPGYRGIGFSKATGKTVAGNTIVSAPKDGIYVADSSKVTKIGGSKSGKNTVTGAGVNGIAVKKATATTISYNVVSKTKSAGIRLESVKGTVTVDQNKVSDTTKQGITSVGNKVKITRNVVKNTKAHAISVTNGTATVSDNTVSGTKAKGFHTSGATVSMISGNVKMKLEGKELIVEGVAAKNASSLEIPSSIKIGKEVFLVTAIQDAAFKNNKKIKSVKMGTNMTKIGASAFEGCKSLQSVQITSKKLKSIGAKAFKNVKSNCAFKVPKSKVSSYKKLLKNAGAGSKATVKKL